MFIVDTDCKGCNETCVMYCAKFSILSNQPALAGQASISTRSRTGKTEEYRLK
jgi:hypothetical protein